jgi:hypothetical protein
MVSCNKDNDFLISEQQELTDPEVKADKGYLALKTNLKDVIDMTTGKPPLEDVLSEMNIYLKDETEFLYSIGPYNEAPATVELAPGTYQLLISNDFIFESDLPQFSNGNYGYLNYGVNITSGSVTTVNAELSLFDVATTITISNEVALAYPDIRVNIKLFQGIDFRGIDGLTWTTAESGLTGYFPLWLGSFDTFSTPVNGSGDLAITLTANNQQGVPVTATKTYTNVSSNEHYQISIEQSETTGLNLVVTLADEVVINDIITFPF